MKPRFKYLSIIIFFILTIILGLQVYNIQKKRYISQIEDFSKKSLRWATVIIKNYSDYLKNINQTAIETFNFLITTNKNNLKISNETETIDVVNFQTGIEESIKINHWYYLESKLYNNASLFKALALSLNSHLLIAQKVEKGYVVINSTFEPIINILFPLNEKFIFIVEGGEYASDIIKIKNKKYFLTAVPLFIEAKIKGILIALTEINYDDLANKYLFSNLDITKEYPVIVNNDGLVEMHPTLKNTNISNTNLFKKIKSLNEPTKINIVSYIWPENELGKNKRIALIYSPEINSYIGITYLEEELKTILNRLKLVIFFVILVSNIIFYIFVLSFTNQIEKINKTYTNILRNIADGDYKKAKINDKKIVLVDKITQNFEKLENLVKKLQAGDYDIEYEIWSEKDEIGKNLKNLTLSLKNEKIKKEEEQQQQIEKAWINEGINKFIEILKITNIKIEDLTYKILSHLVDYTNSQQGAFYLVETDENNQKYLKLSAAYAQNRKILLNRRIEFGAGLIGRVIAEKKLLYITDIEDYTSTITTALSQGTPKSIVIVPLIYNEEIIGVIEINSLYTYNKIQLEFLEKISENISSNLAMWQANEKTEILLEKSRIQAQQLIEQQQKLEQNLKELEKIREESQIKELEFYSLLKAIDTTAIMIEFDKNGIIKNVNSKFYEFFRKRPDEVLGKHHKVISSIDTKSPEYIFFWKDLLEGKSKKITETFVIEGENFWLSETFIPIFDKNGNITKILDFAIDVTENKLMERQLREQIKEISKEARNIRKEERQLKEEKEKMLEKESIFNAYLKIIDVAFPHLIISFEGNIIETNELFEKIIKIDKKTLLGKNIFDFIVSDEIEKIKAIIELVKKGDTYQGTVNILNIQNEQFKLDYQMSPVVKEDQQIKRIVMVITNYQKINI